MKRNTLCFLALVLILFSCGESYEHKPLKATEFKALIENNESVQLVDVRTAEEVSFGSLPNAINLDFFNEDFQAELGKLDRNKPIAVYCTVGQRSGKAYDMLVGMDFKKVYHLEGGLNAWQQAGF